MIKPNQAGQSWVGDHSAWLVKNCAPPPITERPRASTFTSCSIGLTAYNPVQPEVIDHAWLRRTFGNRLAYYGGLSTQTVLSQGSPQEVTRAVQTCLAVLAPENRGLVLGPSHRLMTDTPLDNVEAMLDAFASLQVRPDAVQRRGQALDNARGV